MSIILRIRLVFVVSLCLFSFLLLTSVTTSVCRGQTQESDDDHSGHAHAQTDEEEGQVSEGEAQPLPEGHPEISNMTGEVTAPPIDSSSSFTGRLAIQARQGTKDGPAIGAESVTVEFLHQNQVVYQTEAILDEFGVVVIDDIPLTVSAKPLVKLAYSGVTYYEWSNTAMTAEQPDMTMEVMVYELTEEEPDWYVVKRDAVLHKSENGLSVRENIVVNNPSDKTWFGIPDGSDSGDAFHIQLSSTANNLLLVSGFHGWCCTKFDETTGSFINQMPMMPGKSAYGFGYDLEAKDGQIIFDTISPAKVEKMVIYALSDNVSIQATGMDSEDVQSIANANYRVYVTENMVKGQEASLLLTGFTTVADLKEAIKKSSPAKMIAGISVGLFVLAAFILIIIKSPKPTDVSVE